ncbi:MAG: BamA/TamA family outer membrane protein [Bacteroidaceae bacterium]|nr:BamA/TamA family outer membrane protein [Bacteroidaceae bacterium]
MKKLIYYIFTTLLIISCSTTKYVPDGDKLYTGIKKVEFVDAEENATSSVGQTAVEEIQYALDYAPNGSIAGSSNLRGLPLGLWWYNALHDSNSKVGKWFFKTFAQEPVLLSKVNPQLRANVANNILKYYGYFNGNVEPTVIPSSRNDKKAKVSYTVELGRPFHYDNISYCNFTQNADSLIKSTWDERIIHPGEQFNAAAMENERTRLSTLLRNNGYYYFKPEYITFLADTINKPGYANIRVQPVYNIPSQANEVRRIGRITINVLNNESSTGRGARIEKDTVTRGNITYIYSGKKMPVRVGALMRNIQIRSGELYSQEKQQNAIQKLSQMNIFNNFRLNLLPHTDSDLLDLDITTQLDKPYDFTFELNATSKSNNQIGPGTKVSLAKRNVFRGGETLKLTLSGSYEWQTDDKIEGKAAVVNSWEIGADVSLDFPRLYFPLLHRRYLRVPATTSFRLFADEMNRSGFFRMIQAGGDATYKIQSHSTTTHTVTPFRLTYDMLLRTTEKFDNLVTSNKAIRNSFRDQFIPAMQYTYTYDNTNTNHRNKSEVDVSVTSAGNITSLLFAAFGKPLNQKNKNIFGNPYAQFVKATAELRQLWKIDRNQYIATRLMAGAVHSYGNSEYAPYSEQFYIGGSNSLRAFTVRSVGPGSYRPDNVNSYTYLDETGTLKLEANIEYRFRIISDLHGALFVDAGNIWLLKEDKERPGGEFKFNTFAEQIALNTGFGVRYDLGVLVLRLDFGLGLHAPYDTGRSGYFNLNPFKDGFAWHFAIGYPF